MRSYRTPRRIRVLWLLLVLNWNHGAAASASSPFARRRSLVMFGTMDTWIQRRQQEQRKVLLASSSSTTSSLDHYRPPPMEEEDDEDDDLEPLEPPAQVDAPRGALEESLPMQDDMTTAPSTQPTTKKQRVKMWPPWPFNLLQRSNRSSAPKLVRQGPIAGMGGFLWGFFGQRARVSIREVQQIGSRLWFHLPPMTPPLILLCLLPRQEQQIIASVETGAETVVMRTVIPLWSNPLARTLVLTGFSLAIMSWAHSELNRLRKLTPLPLNDAYREVHSAVLPHVLPEEVPEPFIVEEDEDDEEEEETEEEPPTVPPSKSSRISQKLVSSVPPRLQKHFKKLSTDKPSNNGNNNGNKTKKTPTWRNNLKRMRQARRAEAQKVRRMAIYDELVALQAIKRKAAGASAGGRKRKNRAEEPLGYALVTGASRGIGRAIAVELARWEIPLILVARDLPRLTSLAYDLEACYGIKCCVLQADLAQPNAAQQIHQATQEAGLTVDVLVNNAGISSTGLAVDMPLADVDRMIRVNGVAVAHLAHLYGKDMKERRRGRILMVSSVVGAVTAGPTVAMYAATKAFEKTLGLSLAKELEPYGVGVTCLMPGAVQDTDFRSASSTHEALCWKLPGYPKAPARVANMGIRALLSGNAEVTPGWQNRAFLKVFQPAMPQRLHNILVEIAWNPLMVPPFLKLWKSPEKRGRDRQKQLEDRNKHDPIDIIERRQSSSARRKPSAQEWRPRSNRNLPPPLLLTVPGPAVESAPLKESELEDSQPSLVGPDPVAEAAEPIAPPSDSSESDTSATTAGETEQGVDTPEESAVDPYEELRKLSGELDASSTAESPDSPAASDSTESSSPPSPTTERAADPHQLRQQNESERHLLQLQEQVLKLQQQVQKQEREQFLQQVELERQHRELEYERQDMERERDRQEEDETTRERPQLGWQRRPAQRSTSRGETPIEDSSLPPAPKKEIQPKPRSGSEKRLKRDLMAESLDHPLMSQ